MRLLHKADIDAYPIADTCTIADIVAGTNAVEFDMLKTSYTDANTNAFLC